MLGRQKCVRTAVFQVAPLHLGQPWSIKDDLVCICHIVHTPTALVDLVGNAEPHACLAVIEMYYTYTCIFSFSCLYVFLWLLYICIKLFICFTLWLIYQLVLIWNVLYIYMYILIFMPLCLPLITIHLYYIIHMFYSTYLPAFLYLWNHR